MFSGRDPNVNYNARIRTIQLEEEHRNQIESEEYIPQPRVRDWKKFAVKTGRRVFPSWHMDVIGVRTMSVRRQMFIVATQSGGSIASSFMAGGLVARGHDTTCASCAFRHM
eukprot:GHVU01135223.1.p1 GENE.GHVU01135223.1~~GHVU01135223.1.p1  ORF type:complete len:111 (+),score=4.06 GHVU01135223.1:831-1163(+)